MLTICPASRSLKAARGISRFTSPGQAGPAFAPPRLGGAAPYGLRSAARAARAARAAEQSAAGLCGATGGAARACSTSGGGGAPRWKAEGQGQGHASCSEEAETWNWISNWWELGSRLGLIPC